MKTRWIPLLVIGFCLSCATTQKVSSPEATTVAATAAAATPAVATGAIHWVSWGPEVFEQAKREKKFVLLDLEAIWCHWCHVQDEITYRDPKVIELLNSKYIAVKVDQDSRPDISNRYEDYGWPATIIFNADSGELAKRSGFLNPSLMASLLQAIIDDPTPGPSVQAAEKITLPDSPFLSKREKEYLKSIVLSHYDKKKGSWDIDHKLLDGNLGEYLLTGAHDGDRDLKKKSEQTLTQAIQIIDPVWGGVYQYSTDSNWHTPHFEKIMAVQTENMRIYSLGYAQTKNAKYLRAVEDIHRFLKDFLTSPDGAFYTSQDADLVQGEHGGEFFKLGDEGRRAKGIPRIDKNIYARENGWAVSSLTAAYAATGNEEYLSEALRAAQWISLNRKIVGGAGFSHGAQDSVGPYLNDSLAMANASLNLYRVTGGREWLKQAEETAQFIVGEFPGKKSDGTDALPSGFATAKQSAGQVFAPEPQADENITAARFFNLLFHYTGNKEYKTASEQAMRFLVSPQVDRKFFFTPGILLADREISSDPLHVTVIGAKEDTGAKALFQAALRYPVSYKRIEWWDKKEGPLPHVDVEFPDLKDAAAFACSGDRCSLPAKSAGELEKRIKSMLARD